MCDCTLCQFTSLYFLFIKNQKNFASAQCFNSLHGAVWSSNCFYFVLHCYIFLKYPSSALACMLFFYDCMHKADCIFSISFLLLKFFSLNISISFHFIVFNLFLFLRRFEPDSLFLSSLFLIKKSVINPSRSPSKYYSEVTWT